ncbi:uncharacterized protein [Setaria viridis]|uniref:uncharacterized protein n=1 Tax=Setaria viridis TaxID=4556 RepID=UPI003B3AC24D
MLLERDEFLVEARERLLQAQEHAKLYYDAKHTEMAFGAGDWVWVKLLHRPVASLPQQTKGKLSPRFYGPYQVLERIGDVAYRLQLPPGAHIHNVFHVGVLKPFHGQAPAAVSRLPPLLQGCVLPMLSAVLRCRLARGQWQVLVRWEGLPASEATWEDVKTFKSRYPDLTLEDELFPKEGRDIMVGISYQRRRR